MARALEGFDEPTITERSGAEVQRYAYVVWDGGARRYPLPPNATLRIGRAEGADIRIPHPSVSRQHAELVTGEVIEVLDVGSSNGTRIDGVALEPQVRAVLTVGRAVEIGSALLVVQEAAAESGIPLEGPDRPVIVPASALEEVYALAARVAASSLSVLIQGETGVGKDLVAEYVQRMSDRAHKPFLQVNCAALAGNLLESELFGHEKGAFTGATHAKPGLFEAADGGTLFLDEITELPAMFQAKLLRVVENQETQRIGAVSAKKINVRFISATNRDPEQLVEQGVFRRDLFYRLAGAIIRVPPLRERRSEVLGLAEWFLEQARVRAARPGLELSEAARQALVAHSWPGNVRELKNVIERAVLLSTGTVIEPEHLALSEPPSVRSFTPAELTLPNTIEAVSGPAIPPPPDSGSLRDDLRELERRRIEQALERCGGNQTRAAQLLGIARRTMLRRLEEYSLPRPRKRQPS
jgi:DNA-binding NtrC family response regulator